MIYCLYWVRVRVGDYCHSMVSVDVKTRLQNNREENTSFDLSVNDLYLQKKYNSLFILQKVE